MQPLVKSAKINICLMHFLFRMMRNKNLLYYHWFSALLWNIPLGRSKKIGNSLELNGTCKVRSVLMLVNSMVKNINTIKTQKLC
jgi:hypothetical protein